MRAEYVNRFKFVAREKLTTYNCQLSTALIFNLNLNFIAINLN